MAKAKRCDVEIWDGGEMNSIGEALLWREMRWSEMNWDGKATLSEDKKRIARVKRSAAERWLEMAKKGREVTRNEMAMQRKVMTWNETEVRGGD